LVRQDRIRTGSLAVVARLSVGVAVRAGAPRPDISTRAALIKALLAARSVAFPDPAGGSLGGIYFASLIDQLGIADAIRPRIILTGPATATADLVAKGGAELGVNQIEGFESVAGINLLEPLPPELKASIAMAAGIATSARQPAAAAALVQFLAGPVAAPVIKARGWEPG
jgi:molybdate transport system substrate-binding protein